MKKIISIFILPLTILMADLTLSGGQLVGGTNSPQTQTPSIETGGVPSQTPSIETGGIPSELTGTIYYVSNTGSDTNNGTSEATPWKTLDKAFGQALNPGDGVLFERGSSWQTDDEINLKNGSPSGYVVYGAYGEGPKPILTNAEDKNDPSDWTNEGGNRWSTVTTSNAYVSSDRTKLAQVIINGESSNKLVFHNDVGALNEQGEHCHNESTGKTTIYSVGNPATYYSDIKVAAKTRGVIRPNGRSYWIIDGIHLTNSNFGIVGVGGVSNFKIRNCEVSWIGGALAGSDARYGNGIEFWASHSNGEIYNNKIYQCYDAGITSQYQGTSSAHMSNINVHHNILYQNGGNYEYFNRSSDGSSTNMRVENNIMFNAGGWKMGQAGHSTSWGKNIMLWSHRSNSVPHNGFYIRNNIMWKTVGNREDINGGWSGSDFTIENNTYTKASTLFNDSSNLIGDPLFVDEDNLDFHIQSGSIAVGAGLYTTP